MIWKTYREEIMMTENIEVFINNSIRIRDRIGTIYIDPYEMKEVLCTEQELSKDQCEES